MYGRQRQVGAFDFPHLHRFKPMIGLKGGVVPVVGFRIGHHLPFEELGVGLQVLVTEACPNL